MKALMATILALILALGPPVISAQDAIKSVVGEAAKAGFSELERQLIKKYIGEQKRMVNNDNSDNKMNNTAGKKMPPGLAKRDSLPPGLAAQLQRNGTLPPGLAKRDLPTELESQLPPVREGYVRSILEDLTVVLIEEASGRIADIIDDAMTDNDI